MRAYTFDQYAHALSGDAPHALVQDGWSRLEREIRAVCDTLGYEYKNSVADMINALGVHPSIETEIVDELHALRHKRNAVAHDLDAPPLSAEDAENYARRTFALSWLLAELC